MKRTEADAIVTMMAITEKHRALGKSNQGIRQVIIRSIPWIGPAARQRFFLAHLPVADQRAGSGRQDGSGS
jgi:hypothetical protein